MTLIMIVDDDEDVRKSLKSLLTKNGFQVTLTKDVDDSIKKIDKGEPDLVLLDLFMSGKPVNELIDKYPEIKFVIVSAYLSENLSKSKLGSKLIDCLKLPNVVEKVVKPFDNDNLLRIIKKHIK